MENAHLFNHVTLEMIVALALGVLCVILYSWKSEDVDTGVKRYFQLKPKYISFHIVASITVFLLIGELSGVLIENYIPALTANGTYHNTLSVLTGMFGSAFIAWILEKRKSLFQK
ncbi:hypothetical protein [Maribacter flavus]|uniref:Uncharacterized protein n=1 Tax=Maribacter flavus TaxID=1658664 RepID=A0A5B2TUX1_9FLAO|nr:hypothetical protein [Maribacter flavus]KAA2218267.1 hypothetical protein F0361_01205 [Maribacter flavus]